MSGVSQPLFSRQRVGFGGAPLGNLYQAVDEVAAAQTLALQFVLGSPAVLQVMVGVRTAAELIDADAMFRRQLPAGFWQALQHEGLPVPQVPVPASPPTLT